jgi:hypothetical protein
MLVTRTSQITGKVATLDLEVSQAQLDRIDVRHYTLELVQNIVPDLSAEHREFLMTGVTPEEWNELFNPIEE